MPKVYETERGKKTSNFVIYPSWRCPRCRLMRREAIGRVCRDCKAKEGAATNPPPPPSNDKVRKP